ncbi:MAG: 3-deoxy-7-phosphoheptulonate synthase class II [Myxococcota bacterium]
MSDSPEWHPESWRSKPVAQDVPYEDQAGLESALSELRVLPPLVTSFEVESLKAQIAEAQQGKRFVLQGGDCAETLADCRPDAIASKLKILLQMSMILVQGLKKPVVRVGRVAGQYAKPRSKPTETQGDVTLPNYFGDLVNRPGFDAESRKADPALLVEGYKHAALTLNFIRSLTDGGFADLHHPEFWDLSFMQSAVLGADLKQRYLEATERVRGSLRFMEALGGAPADSLRRAPFFTSHEGLNLHYESAQTRKVPRRERWYNLSTHLPWIGERTRGLDGAHVEFFRGVANPVGVKVGPTANPDTVITLLEQLNTRDEPGKIVLITRMGPALAEALPPILNAVQASGRPVLWMSDPMHGNTRKTESGIKTRSFEAIVAELEACAAAHQQAGTVFGGVHFELTGDDVTECTGGAQALTEEDLTHNYTTACDPRLNYRQALELSFRLAELA